MFSEALGKVLFVLIKFNCFSDEEKEKAYRKGWNDRKKLNMKLVRSYRHLKWFSLAGRVSDCAKTLEYKVYQDGTKKLDKVYFCKDKICPVCNRRRAVKHRLRAEKVFEVAMKKEPKASYLFVTLTVKNVVSSELGNAMSLLTKAYAKLIKRVKVNRNLLGSIRATEITRNKETKEYHPHIHAVFMMKSSYFKGSEYISSKEWSKLWGDSLGVDYSPIVDIRKIKPDNKDLKGALVEAIKYPVKTADFDLNDIQTVLELKDGTFRKRQLAYTGLLKEIDSSLKKESDDDTEQIEEQETSRIYAKWDNDKQEYNWSDTIENCQ